MQRHGRQVRPHSLRSAPPVASSSPSPVGVAHKIGSLPLQTQEKMSQAPEEGASADRLQLVSVH